LVIDAGAATRYLARVVDPLRSERLAAVVDEVVKKVTYDWR
jgi:hypothetical protein